MLACLGYTDTIHGSPGASAKPGPWAWGHPPKTQSKRKSPLAAWVGAAEAKSAQQGEGRSCDRRIKVSLLCDMDLAYGLVTLRLEGLNVTPEGREMLQKSLAMHLMKKKWGFMGFL